MNRSGDLEDEGGADSAEAADVERSGERSRSVVIERIRDLLRKYAALGLPLKLAINVLLGVIVGSGWLGFLSEYAAYSYALGYGIRPPVEGIPYLRASVTALAIAFAGVGAFAAAWIVLRQLVSQIERLRQQGFGVPRALFKQEDLDLAVVGLRDQPLSRSGWYVVVFGIVGGITCFVLGIPAGWASLWQVGYGSGVAALMTYLILRPGHAASLAVAVTVVVVVGAPFALFHPPWYAAFLRELEFGGGAETTVVLSDEMLQVAADSISGGLMLRTAEAVIMYHPDSHEVVEFPMHAVDALIYTLPEPGGGRRVLLPARRP